MIPILRGIVWLACLAAPILAELNPSTHATCENSASSILTLPLLLLALYLGLLVLSISILSWNAHSHPPVEEARRVTAAAERAGIDQLIMPAKFATGAILVFSAFLGVGSAMNGGPALWTALSAALVPLLVAGSIFYCTKGALSTAGLLAGTPGTDHLLSLTSRASLGLILCSEATVALVLLGVHSLAVRELGPSAARAIVLTSASSLGLALIIFARAGAIGSQFTSGSSVNSGGAPHAGSLALLVGSSFHTPLLTLLSVAGLSTLGHAALLTLPALGDGGNDATIWIYPHLVRILGLFSLLFAGLVVRTSDDERETLPWIRSSVIYLLLMIAGIWSLSSELPETWATSVPSGLTFLYLSVAVSLWVGRRENTDKLKGIAEIALLRLPTVTIALGLLLVLIIFFTTGPETERLPIALLLQLVLSGTLAMMPLGGVWFLAKELRGAGSQTADLAFLGSPSARSSERAPHSRLLTLFPLAASFIALSVLGVCIAFPADTPQAGIFVTGLGTLLGLFSLASLVGAIKRNQHAPNQESTSRPSTSTRDAQPGEALNFETSVSLCRDAIAKKNLSWLALAMVPVFGALTIRFVAPAPYLPSLTLGLALGSLLLGLSLSLLLSTNNDTGRRSLGALTLIASLVQTLWLLTVNHSFI